MEGLAGPATDRVDEDVDAPEAIDGLAHHPVRVGLVGRVGVDGEAFGAGGHDAIDRGLERVRGPPRDGDLGAAARHRLGERRADPPPPPGMRTTRPSRLNMSS